MRHIVTTCLMVSLLLASRPVHAQAANPARPARTAVWTVVGAGAGFGVGTWAGLTAFDDAVNSDRKVWTTALVSAAAGGVVAYLLSRDRQNDAVTPRSSRRVREMPLPSLEVIMRGTGLGGSSRTTPSPAGAP